MSEKPINFDALLEARMNRVRAAERAVIEAADRLTRSGEHSDFEALEEAMDDYRALDSEEEVMR